MVGNKTLRCAIQLWGAGVILVVGNTVIAKLNSAAFSSEGVRKRPTIVLNDSICWLGPPGGGRARVMVAKRDVSQRIRENEPVVLLGISFVDTF